MRHAQAMMTGIKVIGIHMSDVQIIECTRCASPQTFKIDMKDSEIPLALAVLLDGGYGMFIDNFAQSDEYEWMLCHKCAHEFVEWMQMRIDKTHQHTGESFCTGWTQADFDKQHAEQAKYVEDELAKRRAIKNGKEEN